MQKIIPAKGRPPHDLRVPCLVSKAHLAVVLTSLLLAAGCRTTPEPQTLQLFEATRPEMGTLFTLSLYAPDQATANRAALAAFARVEELNGIMSDYHEDSEIRRLVRKPVGEPVKVSPDLLNILQISRRLSEDTDAAFDVTIGPLIRYWRRARRQRSLPDPERLAQVRPAVGYEKLQLEPDAGTVTLLASNMFIDLGGIAKGYAADQALKTLREHGINRALVAASGDIRVGDSPPGKSGWKVGVASIDATGDDLTEALLLKNAAVSTSGDTEQYVLIDGVRYSHIVDPKSGLGLRKRIGVTIVSTNATSTDSLATAISVLGAKKGLELIARRPGTEALIVEKDDRGTRHAASPGFANLPRPQGASARAAP